MICSMAPPGGVIQDAPTGYDPSPDRRIRRRRNPPAYGLSGHSKEQRTRHEPCVSGAWTLTAYSQAPPARSQRPCGAQVKLESYARTMAETGVKALFKGILHLVLKHDNKEKIVRLRNQFVPINPAGVV